MVKNAKGKSRLDKFYHLAKEQGFRSRAAFKLIQLNKKYDFFAECRAVLDLCAAPGGWMQVAAKHLPVSHVLVGVDLIPIRPVRGATTLVADITTEKCKKLIERESKGQLFDVVLNDGSPNVGGAWHSESLSQAMLVLDALKLATHFLAPKGWFITKVFRSKDYGALLYVCQQLFRKVEATKPSASRHASAEIFLVCQDYRAPAQIDPKLLDSRHVLQEFGISGKMHGPLVMQKRQSKKMHRRLRDGYEDGASTTFKPVSVMELVKATDPVGVLGLYTQFRFEAENGTDEATAAFRIVRDHVKTTAEIREACQDLQVLGKKEFKKLLKWQLSVSKAVEAQQRAEPTGEKDDVQEVDPETRMMQEMAAIQERLQQKGRKREKRQREMKKQAKKRLAQFKQTEGMVEDSIQDPNLFSLNVFRQKSEVEAQSFAAADPDGLDVDSGSESDVTSSEPEEMKYEVMLEDYLEQSYQRYLRRSGEDADLEDPLLRRRKRLDQKGDLSSEEGDVAETVSDSETEAEERTAGGGLLVELETENSAAATTADAIADQWFRQDIFQDADLMETDADGVLPNREEETKTQTSESAEIQAEAAAEEDSDFEVVKPDAAKSDASGSGTDTEDEFRMLDVDGKAEIVAMARKMLKRKEKENIIDAAYSRYVFHDKNLPKWFEHDNDIHNRPQRMVSRAEIEAEKEMLRAMDCRPIKKVAEAKSRKAKRLATRLRQAMKRAEGIANQEELSHHTRMRQIGKMMHTARRRENGKFATKEQFKKMGRNKRMKALSRMPLKDKRLKSDKRPRGSGRHGKNLKKLKEAKNEERQKKKLRKRRAS